MRYAVALVLVAGLSLAGAACGDEEEASPAVTYPLPRPTTATEVTTTTATTAATQPESTTPESTSSRCVPVPRFVLDGLETGLTLRGGFVRAAQAVRSDDFERVYFVAADIQGPGMQGADQIGLWATNRIDEARGFFAINGFAQEFSDWGPGNTTAAELSIFDDGAYEAEQCARALATAES